MPEPRYRFTVSHTSTEGYVEWEVNTITTEEAFGHLVSSLRTVAHSDARIETILTRFTIAMMEGRSEFAVLDPDLKGQTSFTRTATN